MTGRVAPVARSGDPCRSARSPSRSAAAASQVRLGRSRAIAAYQRHRREALDAEAGLPEVAPAVSSPAAYTKLVMNAARTELDGCRFRPVTTHVRVGLTNA